MLPLVDVFWHHVDRTISSKPRGRKDLTKELKRLSKGRNKNTYTNWFKEPRPIGEARPNLRLSDVEDVATALNVPPGALIAPMSATLAVSALQLDLPFGPDVSRISFEVEATGSALSLRIVRSA
jgi:hypothetical protein